VLVDKRSGSSTQAPTVALCNHMKQIISAIVCKQHRRLHQCTSYLDNVFVVQPQDIRTVPLGVPRSHVVPSRCSSHSCVCSSSLQNEAIDEGVNLRNACTSL
jgi:hypothetical protein